MAKATDQQIQNYVDTRVRPRSEQIRNLYLSIKDDKSLLDDIYSALNQQSPSWLDTRVDSPPHLLTASDVLAWNAFCSALITLIEGSESGDYNTILKSCVRSIQG